MTRFQSVACSFYLIQFDLPLRRSRMSLSKINGAKLSTINGVTSQITVNDAATDYR
jgi:hypothetical protein